MGAGNQERDGPKNTKRKPRGEKNRCRHSPNEPESAGRRAGQPAASIIQLPLQAALIAPAVGFGSDCLMLLGV